MLSSRDWCDPGLGQNNAIDAGFDCVRFHVDMIEIVEQADDIAFLDCRTAFHEWFVVPIERSDGDTIAIDRFEHSLRAGGMMSDRFDGAVQLSLMNERREDTLPRVST